ncbi:MULTISPECIES: hypothetical protein [Acetobacter]|uniref:Uncharacterized protein n=1 Tax=Acetobacter ascendens TaxID=481146 RepID=A0A1Y0V7S6_9PROT|nr:MULTISPECIES: hypothetical protein [Acetobacter]ARW12116.1 hypothetical protein S101447_03079 [Acetobacter ascendens]KAA8388728.1 hypothetical protein FKW31_00100 [Acetobacter sp. DmW_136]
MLDCAVITRKDRFWIPQSVSIPMIRKVMRLTRDFTLTSELLGVTIEEAQAAYEDWDKAPVMHGYRVPNREKAWQREELIILGQMWTRGEQADEIAKELKRSRSSVSGKRRALGLPARTQVSRETAEKHKTELRNSALKSNKKTILTWAQASVLTREELRGRTYRVRCCRNLVTITCMERSDKIRWNEAANIECAYRYFALQSHHVIAQDFLLTSDAIRSHASLEECIPESRRKKLVYFIYENAIEYITSRGIFRRHCSVMEGARFWTNSKLRRLSRRARKSRRLRGLVAAYDLTA